MEEYIKISHVPREEILHSPIKFFSIPIVSNGNDILLIISRILTGNSVNENVGTYSICWFIKIKYYPMYKNI